MFSTSYAQINNQEDITIFTTQGKEISAKLVEITNHTIRYRERPDKSGMDYTYVIRKGNVTAIKHDDGRMETFPAPVYDTFKVGSHLKEWCISIGNSSILNNKNESNYSYSPRFSFGVSRQWGYQISKETSISLGGEYMLYNSSSVCDSTPHKRFSYSVSYLGVPVTLRILKITDKATWIASATFSGGFRYYNDNNINLISSDKPVSIGVGAHAVLCVGAAVRFGKTYFELCPYVDYFQYGSSDNLLGYGVKLSTISL